MPHMPAPRRRSVRGLLAVLALVGAGAGGAAETASAPASAPSRSADIMPLASGVWLLPGRFERARQPDGNSLILEGPDGLVLIDSGRHAEHSDAVLAWARQRRQPLRWVINTHWHLDHLGGNAALRDAVPGLRALASAAVGQAIDERMPKTALDLQRMAADPATDAVTRRIVEIDLALIARRERLRPDEVQREPLREIAPAGRSLRIGLERGVSGGDLWVLDRASGTLAVGDFVTLPVPFLDTACPAEWRAALQRLQALPYERVVPGHGPVLTRESFARYAQGFERLLACAASPQPVAACAAQWVADLGPLLAPGTERSVAPMLAYYFEDKLRADEKGQRKECAAG